MQLDFNMPGRLGATYVGQDGEKHQPVMLHRAILGSIERFIGILIESYAGKLPLWMMPTQCVVTPIVNEFDDYANEVYEALKSAGIRAEIDLRNEKINYKVREHSLAKVPAIFVVGARERDDRAVAIRRLGSRDQSVVALDEAVAALADEAKAPF